MTKKYRIHPNSKLEQCAGAIHKAIIRQYGLHCATNEVVISPGAIKHIKKKHPGMFEKYYHKIPEVIVSPDYVGQNPKEPNSIELYKQLHDLVLIAIKIDANGTPCISTMYKIQNGDHKLEKRLRTGRLSAFRDILYEYY